MDIKLDIKYRLELNRDEWLVVSKALRAFADDLARDSVGDSLQREMGEIAAKLQEQMLAQKHTVLSQMAGEAGKAVANVKAKGTKP
jgi:hypothetical protein